MGTPAFKAGASHPFRHPGPGSVRSDCLEDDPCAPRWRITRLASAVRVVASLVTVVVLLALSGCGGSDEASTTTSTTTTANQPESLADRALTEADAPGSKPDPVEVQAETSDLKEFTDAASERLITDPEEIKSFFKDAGFVSALAATRFYGATHKPDAEHFFGTVVRVGSSDQADQSRDFFHADALKPCPHTCAVRTSEFDVDGIPGATGARRSASKEDVEALGNSDDRPFDAYLIDFAVGSYTYGVTLQGPPGAVTQEKANEIAKAYYDRISDLPDS